MVNNSTNINKNHLSLQLIEWWSTIPPISTKITSHLNSLSDGQQFHQYQQTSPLTSTHWVMVNNSTTNINKNHPSIQLIEWWSTIPPISTKITSHLNSLSGQQFHQYQQKSPLTSTHWVMVNNSTNINKNHLSPQLIEWWSTIPPISTKITSHLTHWVMVNNSTYQQKSLLTSTHWVMVNNSTNINKNHRVMVNNSTNINKNHLSLQLIEWCQQFHQYQPKSPLTSTHWVMVNNSTNINKNHLSPSTHWVMVNNFTNINKNHLSPYYSLSDCQQFHQYQQKSPGVIIDITQWVDVRGDFCWYWWNCLPSLNELRWEVIFVDIGGIVDHHSMSLDERWFLLILVELLTITKWVEVRGDFCWYWSNCWPSFNELKWEVIFLDIGGIVDHHSMSWSGRWCLLILVELLTITQWVE